MSDAWYLGGWGGLLIRPGGWVGFFSGPRGLGGVF